MDILIKNMEMPPHCAYDDKDGNAKLCFMFKYCLEHGYNKINNCPLVALPEHGRLIDADELLASDAIGWGEEAWYGIKNAPTVLEANYGSDN